MPLRTPTEYELQHLAEPFYDPVKAHEYYEKHKKLKGRQKGSAEEPSSSGRTQQQISQGAKAAQRKELQTRIKALSEKLNKLEALIKKREHEEASEDRKSKAKKERSAKEKDKPKSAAEKAEAARDSEKYRDKHKQELKNKDKKDGKSGGGDSKKESKTKKHSVSELKSLATKVKGQIAVAKQKLAAL
jgi:hypothetical protein